MNFYQINQNNSGGSFDVDDKLCHRLFIEANNTKDAIKIAESLGCYWNGVEEGIDCPCCGDRWNPPYKTIDIERYKTEGYIVYQYEMRDYYDTEKKWYKKYGKYNILKTPQWEKGWSSRCFKGAIYFDNIEEYAQFMADEYGWTIPDIRIYYKDGTVKEIFKAKK